jgi:RNA-directed DNA polymerase
LRVSEEKSKILDLQTDILYFLGWEISMKKRKFTMNNHSKTSNTNILIIKPSCKAITNIIRNVRLAFKSYKPLVALISELNYKLRGWLNYYKISDHSKKSFHVIRNYIYRSWWIWARRLHPKRPSKWIYNKYIYRTKDSKWQIGSSFSTHNLIIDPTTVSIVKLKPLKVNVNPYSDKDYYLSKPRIFVLNDYRRKVYKLHKYRCYVCKELLLPDEQIDLHHLVPKKDQGDYSLKNIVPVHKTCHDTITYARKK